MSLGIKLPNHSDAYTYIFANIVLAGYVGAGIMRSGYDNCITLSRLHISRWSSVPFYIIVFSYVGGLRV